jgi:hypothetical protein
LTLTVEFSPSLVGSFRDVINVSSDGGNSAIKLSGSATLPGDFEASTTGIEFGSVAIGSSSTLNFKVANIGFSPLTVTKSKGPILGQFNSIDVLNEGTVLQPGETRIIHVRFQPTSAGSFTDTFTLNSDTTSGLQVITFKGTGVNAPGSISLLADTTPANVTLTQPGVADWTQWNSADPGSCIRMSGGNAQLGRVYLVGAGQPTVTNGSVSFGWTNGSPIPSSSGTTDTIAVSANKTGFRFTAPADTTVRTLRVYVDAQHATGSFVASLSDMSSPAGVDSSFRSLDDSESRVYTITYRASKPGQTLTIAWIKTGGTGTISLSAASLATSDSSDPSN